MSQQHSLKSTGLSLVGEGLRALEQVVQIPDGMVPSTSMAVHVHKELKKSGVLSKNKNAVVYLMSAKSAAGLVMNPVQQDGSSEQMATESNAISNNVSSGHTEPKQSSQLRQEPVVLPSLIKTTEANTSVCSNDQITQKAPQAVLQTRQQSESDVGLTRPSAAPVVTKQSSAVAQIGTLTLPIVAPRGLTLSSSAEYIPILCQIGPGTKKEGVTDKVQRLPVFLLQKQSGTSKRNSHDVHHCDDLMSAAEQSVSGSNDSRSAGVSIENDKLITGFNTKAATSSGNWKIINGSLMKADDCNKSPSSLMSKAMVRLPLGTGQAPSLVTSDGQVHRMEGRHDRSGRQQVLPDVVLKLKEFIEKKSPTLVAAESVQVDTLVTSDDMETASLCSPRSDGCENLVETVVMRNPLLFTGMFDNQRKISYAYETEGLDYAPVLLLDDAKHPNLHVGVTCTAGLQANEYDRHHVGKPSEPVKLDVSCVSASLFKLKDEARLVLNPADSAKCQLGLIDEPCKEALDGELKDINLDAMSGEDHECPASPNRGLTEALTRISLDLRSQDSYLDEISLEDFMGDGEKIGEEPHVDVLDGIVFIDGMEIDVPTPREAVTGFCCYMCGFAALNKQTVVDHWLATHVSDKPYVCGVCKCAAFSNSALLMKHIKCYHSSYKSCMPMIVKPSEVFSNTLIMVSAKDDNISSKQLSTLSLNAETVPPGSEKTEDVVNSQDNVRIFCNSCSFSTVSVQDIRNHMLDMHPKPHCFNCVDCHRLFLCRFDLARHRRIIHGAAEEAGRDWKNVVIQHRISVKINGGYLDWNKVCHLRCDANMPSNAPRLECLICRHKGLETFMATARSMWLHLEATHKWPSHLYCSICANKIRILDIERREKKAYCPACSQSISLQPIIHEESNLDIPVYICRVCGYKTMERSSIFRHVKYSYAQFRPYRCPYCKYSSVEKAKVKKHVMNSHEDQRRLVKVNFDAIHTMKERIDVLMEKLTMKVQYRELDLLLGEDESMYSCEWNEKYQNHVPVGIPAEIEHDTSSKLATFSKSSTTKQGSYQCSDCPFVGASLLTFSRHRRHAHQDLHAPVYVSDAQKSKFLKSSLRAGYHYQCSICHYCCLDRSSMTRHIKYMHMHERPHACPYCGYKNVEKTKVRIHVLSAHSGSPVYVNSDMKVLKMMSQKVKGNYKRIVDKQGIMFEVPKRNPGRPPSDTSNIVYGGVQNFHWDNNQIYPQFLVMNAHNVLALQSTEQVIPATNDINQDDLGITIKKEPESDSESAMSETAGLLAKVSSVPVKSEDEANFRLDLEKDGEKPFSVLDVQGSLIQEIKQEDEELNEMSVSQEEEDGQVVDVAWMVETIDMDSDEEPEDDSSEELDIEETSVTDDVGLTPGGESKKRKWSSEDEYEEQDSKICKVMFEDKKLKLKPVVVLRDVIQQILDGELD